MAANKIFRFGPIDLTTTLTTNLLNPPTASGGVNAGSSAQYIILNHIRVVSKSAVETTCSFWLGASGANAAGTEVIGQGLKVSPNSFAEWFGILRLDAADFLVGGSNTATALTIQGEGEIGVSG